MDEPQNQPSNPPAASGGVDSHSDGQDKTPLWKRLSVIIAGTVVLAAILVWGLRMVARSFSYESTDNAFLEANVVSVAPKISGQVKQVFVNDNQLVKAGDPLVQIDPRDFDKGLEQKKAALAAANATTNVIESSFKMLEVQVNTAEATARQSEAQADADRATAEKASADLRRAQDLIERKIIAPQEYDSAKAGAESATNTWRASDAKAASDRSKVAEAEAELEAGRSALDRAVAQANESQVEVQQADLSLSYTRITAPEEGRVTRKAVVAGDYVQTGQSLMAIVPEYIWVVANFKETQLRHIRTNLPVEIYVDSVGGRSFPGHVESMQAGSGAAFSLLPPENAVGNFVKVVQRVPVKIVFDNPVEAEHVLGPGLSVQPSVLVRKEIPGVVVVIAAIIIAAGIGFFWWRAANKPTA